MKRFIFSLSVILILTIPSVVLSGARSAYVVVIDAGHGEQDPGAIGFRGSYEKDIVLQVAKIVRLRSFGISDIEVILTRTDDTYIELTDRTAIANQYNADLYVSIHANAHNDSRAEGIETWVAERITGDKRAESLDLANSLQASMIQLMQPRKDRGVKSQRLYLRHAEMPSALVELGFLTNPDEEVALNQLNYQLRAADAILQGITNYFKNR